MRKGIRIVLAIIFASIILFLILCPIINNLSAKHIIAEIKSVPLPQDTQIIESFSQAGKLVGNGNGMQFFGAVLIESELSLEDLDNHYSLYRETPWDCIVKTQRAQNIDVIEHGTFSLETDVSNGNYYLVYTWGNGISPFQDLDLRGH